jgi:hypothetical protein
MIMAGNEDIFAQLKCVTTESEMSEIEKGKSCV